MIVIPKAGEKSADTGLHDIESISLEHATEFLIVYRGLFKLREQRRRMLRPYAMAASDYNGATRTPSHLLKLERFVAERRIKQVDDHDKILQGITGIEHDFGRRIERRRNNEKSDEPWFYQGTQAALVQDMIGAEVSQPDVHAHNYGLVVRALEMQRQIWQTQGLEVITQETS